MELMSTFSTRCTEGALIVAASLCSALFSERLAAQTHLGIPWHPLYLESAAQIDSAVGTSTVAHIDFARGDSATKASTRRWSITAIGAVAGGGIGALVGAKMISPGCKLGNPHCDLDRQRRRNTIIAGALGAVIGGLLGS